MNTLGQVALVIGLSVIGAVAYWVYRKDQEDPPKRTPLEWQHITGIDIVSYAPWINEGRSLWDPVTRKEFLRLATQTAKESKRALRARRSA